MLSQNVLDDSLQIHDLQMPPHSDGPAPANVAARDRRGKLSIRRPSLLLLFAMCMPPIRAVLAWFTVPGLVERASPGIAHSGRKKQQHCATGKPDGSTADWSDWVPALLRSARQGLFQHQ